MKDRTVGIPTIHVGSYMYSNNSNTMQSTRVLLVLDLVLDLVYAVYLQYPRTVLVY